MMMKRDLHLAALIRSLDGSIANDLDGVCLLDHLNELPGDIAILDRAAHAPDVLTPFGRVHASESFAVPLFDTQNHVAVVVLIRRAKAENAAPLRSRLESIAARRRGSGMQDHPHQDADQEHAEASKSSRKKSLLRYFAEG